MTGLLIITGLVVLLALALGPAHRRALPWRPGFDNGRDRDRSRLLTDLAHSADRLAAGMEGTEPSAAGPAMSGPELRAQPSWRPEEERRAA